MKHEDFKHDGYMTRLVSKCIWWCNTLDTKQRRQELFIVEHHLGKKARDDHAEVLTAVFNLLRTTKPPYYTNELWPNIDMVRNELIKNEAKKIKPAKVVSINSATTLKRRI